MNAADAHPDAGDLPPIGLIAGQGALPLIVAGDFNTFTGQQELFLFMRAAGLRSANSLGLPSFPSTRPRFELDFVLVSREIEVLDFRVPDIRYSDHRPVICDFKVNRVSQASAA